jgi:hypothetical protein
MKGNKIIATLIVLAMVLSSMVVLNKLNIIEPTSAIGIPGGTPGEGSYGNATTDLKYDVTYSSVYINTSTWVHEPTVSKPLYLYYPTYLNTGAGPNADTFSWNGPFKIGGTSAYVDSKAKSAPLQPTGASIKFNRSGMWIFDFENDTTHAVYAGYIWVNTSTLYSIDSISNFEYGSSGSLTVTVNTGNDTGCMIDIVRPDYTTMYHKWRPDGISAAIKIDATNFTVAGDYRVRAYKDFDKQADMYLYGDQSGYGYNQSYGNSTWGFLGATDYTYKTIGPWDPPEKNATEITFTVDTGKPTIKLTNTTIYWGFKARIDVNVTNSKGAGIGVGTIQLKFGSKYIDFSSYITNLGLGNYSIEIPRYNAGNGWKDLASAVGNNTNGTWRVVFSYDPNTDQTYEWNNSASFVVKSSKPPVQLTLANHTDKKIEWIPAYTSGNAAPTIELQFDITGTSVTNNQGRAFYGDDPSREGWDNITVEGDILYPIDETTLTHGTDGRWTAKVTPTKPGGTITITIDWPGDNNGTASQTLEIVNGTNVIPAVDKFTVGSDFNITVTIQDMDGAALKYAYVKLIWQGHGSLNATNGTNKPGNGYLGAYTFWVTKDDQLTTAPQDITIAAAAYSGSKYWGYAKVSMEKNHNMIINITPTTSYAGDGTEYDITVSLIGGGHPEKTGVDIDLYNSTHDEITSGPDYYAFDGAYSFTNEIMTLSGGTYYLYAYNDTCDSQGYNATLIITKYTVTSSPSVLAWKIDTAVNMTFQVTPAGNGSLTIYNMSGAPAASILGDSTVVPIDNGVGTLTEVNASTLGNVTFSYFPDGGADRPAEGLLRVTTATATPNPATVYIGEATLVTITVTHPATGAPLTDVRVGLDHGINLSDSILAKLPSDVFTDSAGKATFSITTQASGNVTIYIENETDPDNPFVIMSAARKTMTLTADPAVNEGATFTVQAMSGTTLITDATVTITFAGQTYTTTSGTVSIPAPSVSTSLTYTITATALGYTTATATIMVLNVPKLIIVLPSATPKGTQTFTITIANDAGQGVAGATVTMNQQTYTSGANGVTEIKAPDVKDKNGANYPITATFTGYSDATATTIHIDQTPGMPGFELLTLMVALGVAFLLLRRKQK